MRLDPWRKKSREKVTWMKGSQALLIIFGCHTSPANRCYTRSLTFTSAATLRGYVNRDGLQIHLHQRGTRSVGGTVTS
ncbi:hypothetical protein FA95DRAFT_1557706 [Auriscalpium vulgare]|uniref:Uncharacterized protein n=1 Tax=Auriscalpium vulgare TaxID=40419 RepID=A0ACB8RXN5_9AGAM|nr:hypothetical protein FA95DRAFT_1557706 [Auriscalpium vulgare]